MAQNSRHGFNSLFDYSQYAAAAGKGFESQPELIVLISAFQIVDSQGIATLSMVN